MIRSLLLLLVFIPVLAGAQSIDGRTDAFKRDCQTLQRGVGSSKTYPALWSNRNFRKSFNEALKRSPKPSSKSERASLASRSGYFLAAVISRNDELITKTYSTEVDQFLVAKGAPAALTIAASCGYGNGVSLLLNAGADVNSGEHQDAGAFNIALLRGDNRLLGEIMRHGYHLDSGRRCRSSKYILKRNVHPLDDQFKTAITNAVCSKD